MRWRWAGRRKRRATSGKGRWRRSGEISPQEQCGISPADRYHRGSQSLLSCYTSSCKAVERQEEKEGWVGGEGFFPAVAGTITHAPQLRDALTRATAVAGRAYARKGRKGRPRRAGMPALHAAKSGQENRAGDIFMLGDCAEEGGQSPDS